MTLRIKLSPACTAVFFIAVIICTSCVQTGSSEEKVSEEKVLRAALVTGPDTGGGSLDPSISWEAGPCGEPESMKPSSLTMKI